MQQYLAPGVTDPELKGCHRHGQYSITIIQIGKLMQVTDLIKGRLFDDEKNKCSSEIKQGPSTYHHPTRV